MSMFEQYDNLNPDYIPDNSTPSIDFVKELHCALPYKLFDSKHRHIGYRWNASDRFETTFSIADIIRVRCDAIVYSVSGEAPDIHTVGVREGQQAYNTVDRKSWTFVGRTDQLYFWVEDEDFTYPVRGVMPLEVGLNDTASKVQLCIYNFRWEPLKELVSETGESTVLFVYDDETAEVLKSGVYYAVLRCISTETNIIKDRFYLLVE